MKSFFSSRYLARTSIVTAIAVIVAATTGAQAEPAVGSASVVNEARATSDIGNSKVPRAGSIYAPGPASPQADLDRMKAKVAAGEQPWKGSWDILVRNTDARTDIFVFAKTQNPNRRRPQTSYPRRGRLHSNAPRFAVSAQQGRAFHGCRLPDGVFP